MIAASKIRNALNRSQLLLEWGESRPIIDSLVDGTAMLPLVSVFAPAKGLAGAAIPQGAYSNVHLNVNATRRRFAESSQK